MTQVFGEAHRQTRQAIDTHINTIRRNMQQSQLVSSDILLSMLKAGGNAKAKALVWITQALSLNREAEKGHPSPLIASSQGFLINFGMVCLALAKPVLLDADKLRMKVDWQFLNTQDSTHVYPTDGTRLISKEALSAAVGSSSLVSTAYETSSRSEPSTSITFITQSFFLCWRALHLGIVHSYEKYYEVLLHLSRFQSGLQTNEPRSIHVLVMKLVNDTMLFGPEMVKDLVLFVSATSDSLLHALTSNAGHSSAVSSESWILSPSSLTSQQARLLDVLPEHLLEDLLTIIFTIGKVEPTHISSQRLDSLLSLCLFFLRRPWCVQSPHLRAKIGEVIFQVFIPHRMRAAPGGDYWTQFTPAQQLSIDGPHSRLVETMPECIQYLAPALLLLYGDVERTGFYDKLKYRRSIMIVLKYLWSLPQHRAAFRGIASLDNLGETSPAAIVTADIDSAASANPQEVADINTNDYFIRFANGLMNEANALITATMEKLSEIKKTQTLMRNESGEWGQLPADTQQQLRERLQQHESEVKSTASLCLETLNMMNYLTSDEDIRRNFLLDAILPRFVSMFMSVLTKIVGTRSLDIKVDNMEQYNFDPRAMLRDVCESILHFAVLSDSDGNKFTQTLADDGFFSDKEGQVFAKMISTVSKLQLVSAQEIGVLQNMYEKALTAKSLSKVNCHLCRDHRCYLIF
jgi:ubiquitin conjugation factor E4 B